MLKRVTSAVILATAATTAVGQTFTFRNGETELPDGSFYSGTIDNEFRAADPTDSQAANAVFSIDDFDDGFQTQGAIRFENLLVSQGGLIPDGIEADDILFAEFGVWVTSPTESSAQISFNRVVGPDSTSGAFWGVDDTWASLGGDLIPDEFGVLDGDPILEDGVEAAAVQSFGYNLTAPAPFIDPTDNVGGAFSVSGPFVDGQFALTADDESQDLLSDLIQGLPRDDNNQVTDQVALNNAVGEAFLTFDVTNDVVAWLVDGAPNFGWSVNNNTGNGWDFFSSDLAVDPLSGEALGEGNGGVTDLTLVDESAGQAVNPILLRPFLSIVISDLQGDLDGDDDIDLDDYGILLNNLAIELDGPIEVGSSGDFDFDSDVDLADFQLFQGLFQNFNGMTVAQALAIPEPTSVVLLSLAGCGLLATRRR